MTALFPAHSLRVSRHMAQAALLPLLFSAASASALTITPVFESSITSLTSTTRSEVEGAINSAINTLDNLYTNNVNISVDFTYTAAGSGNLLSTTQYYDAVTYNSYVSALTSDLGKHSTDSVLSTALTNIHSGNDGSGSTGIALSYGLAQMLGLMSNPGSAYNAVININSSQNFSFTQPTSSSQYDLIGGLEHELDEVLGGGGGGSSLGQSWQGSYYGPLDLYRYSATHTASYSTSAGSSYFSINGGVTNLVNFNQTSGGDYGDLGPACNTSASGGLLIQNAFNCTGAYEAYTASSIESTMLESVGWATAAVPEPATVALLLAGLLGMGAGSRRRPI